MISAVGGIVAIAVGVATLLGMLVGLVVWAIRLEGKVGNVKDAIALAMQVVTQGAALDKGLAVLETKLEAIAGGVQDNHTQTANAIQRIAGLEVLVEHIANEVCDERVRKEIRQTHAREVT